MDLRKTGLTAASVVIAAVASAQVITQNYLSAEYDDNANDIPLTAGPLIAGAGGGGGVFYMAQDVDYYHLQVTNVPSTLTVLVDGIDSLFGACDPKAWLEDSQGNMLAYNDDIMYPVNLDSRFQYVFNTPGDYYVGTAPADPLTWNWQFSNYTLSGTYSYIDVDTEPPSFPGGTSVKRAVRLSSKQNQSAVVSWNRATDNRTPSDQIKYNIYVATSAAGVFSGAPGATFTGALQGIVGGLSSDSSVDYWVGVRCEDAAGNEDQNTAVVLAETALAVPTGRWMLYR